MTEVKVPDASPTTLATVQRMCALGDLRLDDYEIGYNLHFTIVASFD